MGPNQDGKCFRPTLGYLGPEDQIQVARGRPEDVWRAALGTTSPSQGFGQLAQVGGGRVRPERGRQRADKQASRERLRRRLDG